jgi:hypothetical protein
MLIDNYLETPDAVETHRIEIRAEPEDVYRALWQTDFGSSLVIKGLLGLRALPEVLLGRQRLDRQAARRIDLEAIIRAGFGKLAEEENREVVLGVLGRFWRPTGNLLPFRADAFDGPVPPGLALAVWNFNVRAIDAQTTMLETETRVACGDSTSRRKFRFYWLAVRPFSGWIRLLMLRAVRREVSSLPVDSRP